MNCCMLASAPQGAVVVNFKLLQFRFLPYITASVIGRSPHNLIDIYVGSGVNQAGEVAQ